MSFENEQTSEVYCRQNYTQRPTPDESRLPPSDGSYMYAATIGMNHPTEHLPI